MAASLKPSDTEKTNTEHAVEQNSLTKTWVSCYIIPLSNLAT